MPHPEKHAPRAGSAASLQASIEDIGNRLLDRVAGARSPLLSARGVYGRLMDWAMKDESFKVQLFRFVDVLPVLSSNAQLVRHLQEYLGDGAARLPPLLQRGLAASNLAAPVVAAAVRANVASLARQFIAGGDPGELCEAIARLHGQGVAATVDLLGEMAVTDAEALRYQQRNLDTLDALAAAVGKLGAPCASDLGPGGAGLPRVNLSVKISALHAHINPAAPDESLAVLKDRLRPILRRAIAHGALINFDMESHAVKGLTLRLFTELLEEPEFAHEPAMGIALQAYLHAAPNDLDRLIAWSLRHRRPIAIRLVKGAYWDYEAVLARQRGWPVPVWLHKPESDLAFERMTVRLLDNIDLVQPAFATHNVRSIAHVIAQARRRGLDDHALEFQMLFGMADPIMAALRAEGWRVRAYCPSGDLLPGMAYFVRRLLENTSNEGFLRHTFVDHADRASLLGDPALAVAQEPAVPPQRDHFANEPTLDFSHPEVQEGFSEALAVVRGELGRAIGPCVDGVELDSGELLVSVNPARPSEIVARTHCATPGDADRAVEAARRAAATWAATPADSRAALLDKAAGLMRERRLELAALEVFEAGKPWAEADADVTEAIDFCRYYAREMRRLGGMHAGAPAPGESSVTHYLPRGVAVAIAPWNFPLAILCGMTAAALVTGNSVIMKPAEQTPAIGERLFRLLREAGIPSGALHFLPGPGESVGARLVAHPGVDLIAFTGSREVGLRIWETAGRTPRGQVGLKKVVCEMGGKNALIVDDDADLDEAVPGAVYSAFGFAGQKCSALSRLIVLEGIYDKLLARLIGCSDGFTVDAPEKPRARMGPVIDAAAQRRILASIEEARATATLAWQGKPPGEAEGGYFVPPCIFTDVPRDSKLAREEVFGPVLALFKARDIDEAITLANDSDYALTAGIYSRSPANIGKAREKLAAGNVYVNRPITGALVGRHPFGGYRLSGGGTKAGGADYLLQFLVPRTLTENTMRRGFAPEDGEPPGA